MQLFSGSNQMKSLCGSSFGLEQMLLASLVVFQMGKHDLERQVRRKRHHVDRRAANNSLAAKLASQRFAFNHLVNMATDLFASKMEAPEAADTRPPI